MKNKTRRILLTVIFSFVLIGAKAQFVTIPDANFVTWLTNNGFGGCMSGNQMDTTCTAILNASKIYVEYAGIFDLEGIRFFKSLDTLDCSGNYLDSLPKLPDSLLFLRCDHNSLDNLPSLPGTLKFLECGEQPITHIDSLPPGLEYFGCARINFNPNVLLPPLTSLKFLDCTQNNIDSLPSLPPSLEVLYCSFNQNLNQLPALPSTMKYLSCVGNGMTNLPVLPQSLQKLYCKNNYLTTLPNLPDSLTSMDCSFNQITSIPNMPSQMYDFNCGANQLNSIPPLNSLLKYLYCFSNQLTILPALSAWLTTFDCSYNSITSLPALPGSLEFFYCQHNQLTSIPVLPQILAVLNCSNNQISTLQSSSVALGTLICDSNQLISLPNLPLAISTLSCSSNLLTSLPPLRPGMVNLNVSGNIGLTCLPSVKIIWGNFFWSNTSINCLPNVMNVTNAIPAIDAVPICDISNANGCPVHWNIKGTVFKDSLINCVPDSGELKIPNVKVVLLKNGILEDIAFINSFGQYSFETDTGNFTDLISVGQTFFGVSCPASGIYNVNVNSANLYHDNRDFALTCYSGFDVGTTGMVVGSGQIRPGHQGTIKVFSGDVSSPLQLNCANGINGTIQIVKKGPASYIGPAQGSLIPVINGDTLLYTIPNFGQVNFYNDISFIIQTDTTANIGSQVCFAVEVLPLSGDNNLLNNFYSHCFEVRASYDPNFKEVNPVGATDTSEHWFNYTIHFQNIGTSPAWNINIIDTLDNYLIENSIEVISYSHMPGVQLNGMVLRFNFPGINLPDSTSDEPNSHGYVQYKIKRKDNLLLGTQIRNTAYIYFDFNAPVVTNTTLNQLSVIVGIASNNKADVKFSIYPNPLSSGNNLNLFFNSTATQKTTLSIYELSGKKVYTSVISSSTQSQQITIPDLAQGIYQCVVDGVDGSSHQKLVIVH